MTTAERMRKYRARKRLIAAIQKAEKEGVDVLSVLDECSMQMFVPGIPGSHHNQRNADRRYGKCGAT